jgi:hypothetical protein
MPLRGIQSNENRRFMSITSIMSLLLISPVVAMAQQATTSLPRSNPSPLCATLVLHGGKIWTGDRANPEATAIAIYRHRIVVVGSDQAALAFAGESTRVIDLDGRRVVPGLIDDHVHFLPPRRETSPVPRGPNLRASNSEAGFARGIGKYVAQLPAGTWFTAGSWNHERWPGGKLPTRALVDKLSPNNPVCLVAGAGHIAFANGAALKIAGITAKTKDPFGGQIVRDPGTGEPTGVLKNNAINLVTRHVPRGPIDFDREYARALRKQTHAASLGITGFSENLDDVSSLAVYNTLLARHELRVRLHVYPMIDKLDAWLTTGIRTGTGNRFLRYCGLKSQVDGALRAASALMLESFSDSPGNRGIMMEDLSPGGSLEQRYARCVEAGIQPMTHAIGDKAIRLVLDIFQRVGGENVAKYRFRIERAQHPQPEEIRRFGKLGIVISAQPYAVISDGVYAEKRLGAKRCETTLPFRDIIDSGAVLAFGSDSGGGDPSPMLGIYAAVTRASSDPNCPDGWIPQQKITVAEALRAYTFGTAYACFFDDQAGTLQAGKLADLVVLDTDILNVPPQRIRDVKALLTIIDGTKSWLAPEAPWKWEIP